MKSSRILRLLAVIALIVSLATPCLAETLGASAIIATKPALGLGILACLASSDDPDVAMKRAIKAADATIISIGIAHLVKATVDIGFNSKHDHSFPSGHTAAAFAMATSLSDVHPKQKWYYYAGAAIIGWGSHEVGGHDLEDVIGGAALGIAVGKLSIKSENGLLIGKVFKF
ncbi:MAG: phosphatase PAP2 family protein [Armatimonadota bacterium]|nr:phosphatase PAP2 family protein [Armatimonadota bacterium]